MNNYNKVYSFKFYKWASTENDALSLLRIGDYYYYGIATEVNYGKAASYYKKLESLEEAEGEFQALASYNLGYMY